MNAHSLPARRIAVVALLSALTAVVAVAGPLASRASAVSVEVFTAQDFRDAITAINLTSGESHTIQIENDLVFDGSGGGAITVPAVVNILGWDHTITCVNACGTWIYSSDPASLIDIRDVTVMGFDASAIRVDYGDLTISDSTFTDNVKSPASGDAYGGAIRNVGGGGIYGTLSLDGVVFDGNEVNTSGIYTALGGAIYHAGPASILNSTFNDNSASAVDATSDAGAVYLDPDNSGTVIIRDSEFTDNSTTSGSDLNSNAHGGALLINWYTTGSQITGSHFEGNSSNYYAGAISLGPGPDFLIGESTFADNSAAQGGGALTYNGSAITVADSTFDGNSTGYYGGAAWLFGGGTATVSGSLFTSNAAQWGGGIAADNGGLAVTVSSTTFTQNAAPTGAAVFTRNADIDLQHLTVINNSANAGPSGGQLYVWDADAILAKSVIVDAAGGGPNCSFAGVGTLASGGYNATDDSSCTVMNIGDIVDPGFDPELGELEFYGGPTLVMVPDADGPLVNAIPSGSCTPAAVDQRGVTRPQDGACDIGAVEIFQPLTGAMSTPGGVVWVRLLNAFDADGGTVPIATLTPAPPAGVAFPYGAIELEIDVWDDGWPADIQLFSPAPTTQVWKLFDGEWVEPPGATHENGEGGTLWTFRVTDGGFGDNDLTANSTIVDPSAMGVAAAFTG
jgi:hypothetical protein